MMSKDGREITNDCYPEETGALLENTLQVCCYSLVAIDAYKKDKNK